MQFNVSIVELILVHQRLLPIMYCSILYAYKNSCILNTIDITRI